MYTHPFHISKGLAYGPMNDFIVAGAKGHIITQNI